MINRFLTKNKKYVPIFLFSGVSGSTAMNSFIRIYGNKPYIALLIKKNKEQTHRTNVEVVTKNCPEGHDKFFYIFLDDVIDSGKTLKNCIKTINNKNNIKWLFSLIKIENISTKYKFYFMYDKFDANEDEIYDFKPLKKYK
jgi:orotate phosphoribosyltransferase-like protein